jgi:hypothetical protein
MSLTCYVCLQVMKTLVVVALLVFLSEHFLFQQTMMGEGSGSSLESFYYCPVRQEDVANGVQVTVERHNGEKEHGDVCRMSTGEW